ncbi:hypothetical protein ACQKGO_33330 [Corallococcus interemptor]|uniref:hypothetical protein n=1 Tax=Corallococcus interemptor TaxID=2316720 RepID=UPI003D02A9E7
MMLRRASFFVAVAVLLMSGTSWAQEKSGKSRASSPAASPPVASPPQLEDDWKGLAQVPTDEQRVLSLKEKSGFGLSLHHQLAENAGACSEQLISAQYRQDIVKQFDASAHFDNCAFEESFAALDREIAQIDKLLANPTNKSAAAREAMSHLGRMLHAAQDFYAHSNWVELQHTAGAAFESGNTSQALALVVPVWTEAGRKRVRETKNLVSGYVWWEPNQNKCATTYLTHSILAKDSPSTQHGKAQLHKWKRSGFSAAFTLAQMATGSLVQWAYARWPLLAQECGNDLYVMVTADKRPE